MASNEQRDVPEFLGPLGDALNAVGGGLTRKIVGAGLGARPFAGNLVLTAERQRARAAEVATVFAELTKHRGDDDPALNGTYEWSNLTALGPRSGVAEEVEKVTSAKGAKLVLQRVGGVWRFLAPAVGFGARVGIAVLTFVDTLEHDMVFVAQPNWDDKAMISGNTFVIPQDGKYWLSFRISISVSSVADVGIFSIYPYRNAVGLWGWNREHSQTGGQMAIYSAIWQFSKNDVIKLRARAPTGTGQWSCGENSSPSTTGASFFEIEYIRP